MTKFIPQSLLTILTCGACLQCRNGAVWWVYPNREYIRTVLLILYCCSSHVCCGKKKIRTRHYNNKKKAHTKEASQH